MNQCRYRVAVFAMIALVLTIGSACGHKDKPQEVKSVRDRILLGAYTVPKEAYLQKIIPGFVRKWKAETGRDVFFETSFVASGAQARAIAAGFEADIAALSLEGDIDKLALINMVDKNWKEVPFKAMVSRSLVVGLVRAGNPKGITTWQDLTRTDVNVIYPSPKTSGGAMWVVNAIYGVGLLNASLDQAAAIDFLKRVQSRVKVMDVSGRASVTTFEQGIGDVLLGYENEALLRQMQGKDYEIVYLTPTMVIENPVAIVRSNVARHGNGEVVRSFVDYLWTPEAQRIFSEYGFRSVLPEVEIEFTDKFPKVKDAFTIEFLGGWEQVMNTLYSSDGIWTNVINAQVR